MSNNCEQFLYREIVINYNPNIYNLLSINSYNLYS